ncbi:hypothetical protein VP01_7876g1, partial [Puccinia sorghi]
IQSPGPINKHLIYTVLVNGAFFSKCISSKYKANDSSMKNSDSREFSIYIPGSLLYEHEDLFEVPISDFSLIYSEIVTYNGSSFAAKSGYEILGMISHVFITQNLRFWLIQASDMALLFTAINVGNGFKIIPIPNPWQIRANGKKIICHVPINLFADDTSGNKSKRWNKHVSFCFKLSGLSPMITDMEYNCHFIGTSNVYGPLELAEPIVQELKYIFRNSEPSKLATEGCVGYDYSLQQEVLFMTISL